MPETTVIVRFAAALQRHVACPPQAVAPGSLAEVFDSVFRTVPELRHYVLDDQGQIRKHVAVFVNQRLWRHRDDLSLMISAGDRIEVAQALSGG